MLSWQLLTLGFCSHPPRGPHRSPAPAGGVLIDDRPVGDYNKKWLKQRVALVSQEPVLYARSIRRWVGGGGT
jgi:hypothetical protein